MALHTRPRYGLLTIKCKLDYKPHNILYFGMDGGGGGGFTSSADQLGCTDVLVLSVSWSEPSVLSNTDGRHDTDSV